MSNNYVICLEGVDRTGKDTLRQHIVKESKGNSLVIVRSFISQVVYSRIYNRNIDEQYFINQALECQKLGHIFVHLIVDINLIKQRIIDTNEQDVSTENIENHISIFNQVIKLFKDSGLKILTIDVSDQNLDRIYNLIANNINEK